HEIYSRLKNGDCLSGQRVATFEVWPTGRPFIVMVKGERLTIPLRVWRGQTDARYASVVPEGAEAKSPPAPAALVPASNGQQTKPFPDGAINYRIRQGSDRRGFWIDVDVAGVDKSGQYSWSANVTDPSTGESFPVEVSALVLEENLIVNPRNLDPLEVSLAALKDRPLVATQLNVRKMIGSIHIKAVSSTLGFVKGGWQVLIDGSNYLVKVYIVANPGVAPGKYEGTIRIETDEPSRPQIDVPFKLPLIQ